MSTTYKANWRMIALYPAIFVIIVSGAIIFGMLRMEIGTSEPVAGRQPAASVQAAPSAVDYRAIVRERMAPFFLLVESYSEGAPVREDAELLVLVQEVREGMLEIRVPSSERDAHLSMVLMLDQWQRALSGSVLDGRRALASADRIAQDYPWSVSP